MDWTHSNSVFFDENSESVFVSVRNLSRITKIDYDSKDQSDPFLLRRCTTGKWDNKQKWEVKASNGLNIPEGWEPFAYDSNDNFDPFLLRRRTK